MQQISIKDVDTIVGTSAAVVGGTGITLQAATQTLNLFVLLVNALIGLGGLYLVVWRIRKIRREAKERAKHRK